jgi:4'-phosphopantetheinyl transferase
MRASFAPLEWTTIRSHATPAEQLRQFFIFWTLKESFIKNIGIGLGLDLERMEFYYLGGPSAGHYDEVRLRLIPKGDEHDMDTSDYRFHHFPLDETHAAAGIRTVFTHCIHTVFALYSRTVFALYSHYIHTVFSLY